MSQPPNDDVMSKVKEAHGNSADLLDRVAPDLLPLLLDFPQMTFDQDVVDAINSNPMKGPPLPGVGRREVDGIGDFYHPSPEAAAGDEGAARPPSNAASVVLWIHGGGRVMGSPAGDEKTCSRIVRSLGVPVLSADHRLAPKDPFPAALDDVHKAYLWLAEHLKSQSDATDAEVRIAVMGESAGAGLGAELCQRLLDESREGGDNQSRVPLPACQLLIYPMLDDRTCVNDNLAKLPPHLIWNNDSNAYAWSCYLGPSHKPGDETLPEYASASRRKDLSGLPPAHVQVGDLDLFHDESAEYARRLREDGVETEFYALKGGYHAYVALGLHKDVGSVVEAWDKALAFGGKHLLD